MIYLFELPIGTSFRRLLLAGAFLAGYVRLLAIWHDFGTGGEMWPPRT